MGGPQDGGDKVIYTNSITGVNVYDVEQGSDDWLSSRLGVITASRAHDIIKRAGQREVTQNPAKPT